MDWNSAIPSYPKAQFPQSSYGNVITMDSPAYMLATYVRNFKDIKVVFNFSIYRARNLNIIHFNLLSSLGFKRPRKPMFLESTFSSHDYVTSINFDKKIPFTSH